LLIAVSLVNQRGDEILCQNVPVGGTGVYFFAFAYLDFYRHQFCSYRPVFMNDRDFCITDCLQIISFMELCVVCSAEILFAKLWFVLLIKKFQSYNILQWQRYDLTSKHASTGPVLGRCCQHRPITGPVLAPNGS